MNIVDLTADSKAILLLCSRFSSSRDHLQTLTGQEYNLLLDWMRERDLSPGDLFEPDTLDRYNDTLVGGIMPERIRELLARGGEMAVAVEGWLNSGFWIISREDYGYPSRAVETLGRKAPLLLFGAGDRKLLGGVGLAIVGSRNVDRAGEEFAFRLGEACAGHDMTVISGGARGVDSWAMRGALEHAGKVVGVLAGDLARTAASIEVRQALESRHLVLVSLYRPEVPFTVGGAMERNKLIYGLSQAAVIVSADEQKGGTWSGAKENHKNWHVPMFVRIAPELAGNTQMLKLGLGLPFPDEALDDPGVLINYESKWEPEGTQTTLL